MCGISYEGRKHPMTQLSKDSESSSERPTQKIRPVWKDPPFASYTKFQDRGPVVAISTLEMCGLDSRASGCVGSEKREFDTPELRNN
jgi:hypothetical protein